MIDKGIVLEKLYRVFKDGYRPSRLAQSYSQVVVNQDFTDATQIVNCLAHAMFNLTNEVLQDYGFTYQDALAFKEWQVPPDKEISVFDDIVHFVKDAGLRVQQVSRKAIIKSPLSWRVLAYFRPSTFETRRDFHFFLDEAIVGTSKEIYSHKAGTRNDVWFVQGEPDVHYLDYYYVGTYMVTNPHTDFSNPYNKPTQSRTIDRFIK